MPHDVEIAGRAAGRFDPGRAAPAAVDMRDPFAAGAGPRALEAEPAAAG